MPDCRALLARRLRVQHGGKRALEWLGPWARFPYQEASSRIVVPDLFLADTRTVCLLCHPLLIVPEAGWPDANNRRGGARPSAVVAAANELPKIAAFPAPPNR